jgi:hypothetical protein
MRAHTVAHYLTCKDVCNSRHVWLKVAQEPSYDNIPLDMRVDERYLRYPAACTPNVSVCSNTPGSHTCSCQSGYILSGNDCVKAGVSGSYVVDTVARPCPAGAISKSGAKSKKDCVCPAGHFRDASNKDLADEDRPCIPCPAGWLALADHVTVTFLSVTLQMKMCTNKCLSCVMKSYDVPCSRLQP